MAARRHMIELMQAEQLRHRRSSEPVCLALLDIDLFKSVNDSYGHQADEFMVLFVATAPADAMHALERLQQAIQGQALDDIAPGLRVSFSGGVAALLPHERLEDTIERADQAMYQAKTRGRSRSVLAPELPAGAAAVQVVPAVPVVPLTLA